MARRLRGTCQPVGRPVGGRSVGILEGALRAAMESALRWARPQAPRCPSAHGGSRSPLSPALPAADGTHRTPEDMAEQILDYLEAHGYLHDPRLRSVLNGNGNGSLKHAARAG